jgi:hypothetical protein
MKPRDRNNRRFSRFNRCNRRETTTRLQAQRADQPSRTLQRLKVSKVDPPLDSKIGTRWSALLQRYPFNEGAATLAESFH